MPHEADYINKRLTQLKTFYQGRDAHIVDRGDLRYLRKPPEPFPGLESTSSKSIRYPGVHEQITQIAALITAHPYMFEVRRPLEEGPDEPDDTEDWLNGLFWRLEEEAGRSIFRRVADSCLLYGRGVFSLGLRKSWLEKVSETGTYEGKQAAGLPYFMDYIPAATYYPWPDEFAPEEVMIAGERPSLDLARMFGAEAVEETKLGVLMPSGEVSGLPTVNFVEYLDHDTNKISYWAGSPTGDLRQLGPTRDGWVRYFCAPGFATSSSDPHEASVDLFYAQRDVIAAYASALSTAVVTTHMLMPRVFQELPEGVTAPTTQEIELKLYNTVPAGSKVQLLQGQGHPLMEVTVERLSKILSEATGQEVLMGLSGGASSDVQFSDQRESASAKYQGLVSSLATTYIKAARWALDILEDKLNMPVPIWSHRRHDYVTLKPDDVMGWRDLDCIIDTRLPSNARAEAQFRAQGFAAGLDTREEAVRARGYRNFRRFLQDRLDDVGWTAFETNYSQKLIAEEFGVDQTPPVPGQENLGAAPGLPSRAEALGPEQAGQTQAAAALLQAGLGGGV